MMSSWASRDGIKFGKIVGIVIVAVITGIFVLGPNILMDRGRAQGIETVQKMLKLAGQGNYSEIESSGLATDNVIKWLRERDGRWGKVTKVSLEDAYVQVFGTPWGIEMKVWRERKAVLELFGGNAKTVHSAQVPWPDAEK